MKGFNERTRAFEAKFARDNEVDFIVSTRACKILAKWVAEEKLGLKPRSVKRYCEKVVALSIRNCNTNTMFEYIQKRLKRNKVEMDNRELEYRYGLALQEARANL